MIPELKQAILAAFNHTSEEVIAWLLTSSNYPAPGEICCQLRPGQYRPGQPRGIPALRAPRDRDSAQEAVLAPTQVINLLGSVNRSSASPIAFFPSA